VAEEWLLPGGLPDASTPWESISMAGLSVVFYLRLGKHMQDVRDDAAA
jgi:hypothetical protein